MTIEEDSQSSSDGEELEPLSIFQHQFSETTFKETGENLLSFLLASREYSVTVVDIESPDHPLIDVSPGFEMLTGYTREEVIGRNCRFLQGNRHDQENIEVIRQAIRTGTSCQTDLINFTKSGKLFYNRLQLFPIMSNNGRVRKFLSIQNDVTEFIATQAVLTSNSSKYMALIDYMPFPMCVVNRNGVIVEANKLLRQNYQASFSTEMEANTSVFREKTIDNREETFSKEIEACIANNEAQTIKRFSLQSGELRFLESKVLPIATNNVVETALIITADLSASLHDSSLKSKARDDLHSIIVQQLNQSIKAERNQVAMELHDNVGQLLTALSFEIEQLMSMSPTRVGRAKEILELINDSIRDTIDKLLPNSFMSDSVEDTIRVLFNRICADKLELNLEVNYSEWVWEEEDLKSLLLVIQELFSNTAKHSKASECSLSIVEENDVLNFYFSDNGVGLPQVFTFHERLRFGGLSNIQQRITRLGGDLKISSSRTGTSFVFAMPYPKLQHA